MPEETLPQIRHSIVLNSIQHEAKSKESPIHKTKSYSMKKLTFVPVNKTHRGKSPAQKNDTPKKQQKTMHVLSEKRGSRLIQLSKLKLSPIKQYQTKLKISAESWLVYDYRKDSYERGWHPSSVKEFNGMIRLVVMKVFVDLLEQNPELANFQMRVNEKYLKEEIEDLKESKKPPEKKFGVLAQEAMSRGLKNSNTVFIADIVIGMIDLLYGIFMTNHDDMVEYAIVFMGYLCNCHVQKTNPISEDSPCHFIETIGQALTYGKYFSEYTTTILFPALDMKNSKFQPRYNEFSSSANDVCRLFLALEPNELFRQILNCKDRVCKIKYQIGFRYWENRTLYLKNMRVNLGEKYFCTFNWKSKKNYCSLCRNLDLNVVTVFQDCKFGMVERDVFHVEEWVKNVRKPRIDNRRTHAKLLPMLRPYNYESPEKNEPEKINEDSEPILEESEPMKESS